MLEDGQPVERAGRRFRQPQLLTTGVVKLTASRPPASTRFHVVRFAAPPERSPSNYASAPTTPC